MSILNYIKRKTAPAPISEEDTLLIEIITKMCDDPSSEFRMSTHEKYYGINEKLQYYIVACEDYIKITNHTFYLMKYGHIKQMNRLIDLIRNRIDNDRDMFEEEIFKNEINLLKGISTNITKLKNDTNKKV